MTSAIEAQHSKCHNILGLQPLLPLTDAELHLLAFDQRAVAVATDSTEMDEYIRARLTLNEAKSLGIVEPFNRTGLPIRHSHNLHIT